MQIIEFYEHLDSCIEWQHKLAFQFDICPKAIWPNYFNYIIWPEYEGWSSTNNYITCEISILWHSLITFTDNEQYLQSMPCTVGYGGW